MRLKCDVWSGGIYRSLSLKKSTGRKEDRMERRDGWGGCGDVGCGVSRGITLIFKAILQRRQSFASSVTRGDCQDVDKTVEKYNDERSSYAESTTINLSSAECVEQYETKRSEDPARGVVARGTNTEFNKRSPRSYRPDPTSPPQIDSPHFKHSIFSFFISL